MPMTQNLEEFRDDSLARNTFATSLLFKLQRWSQAQKGGTVEELQKLQAHFSPNSVSTLRDSYIFLR